MVRELATVVAQYDLQAIAYDRWRMADLLQMLEAEGVALPLTAFGQGFKDMAPAVDEFERMLVNGELKHDGNPVMTWCAANAVLQTDPAGNRKVSKQRATGRVDGIVAAVMAVGAARNEGGDNSTPELIIL